MKEETIKAITIISFFILLIAVVFLLIHGIPKKDESSVCQKYKEVINIDYQTNFWGTKYIEKWSDGSFSPPYSYPIHKIGDKECSS